MIIYKATNQLNGKVYIGQTTNFLNVRKLKHISDAMSNCIYHFHNAIRKNGKDSFKWEIIRICDSIESLNAFEQYYILYYNSMENGYNRTSGGLNYKASKETKEKQSIAHLNMSEETKKKMSVSKLNMSDETKEKMRQANLGRKMSEQTKAKISKALSGKNHPNYGKRGEGLPNYGKLGKKRTQATKDKISKNSARLSGNDHHMYGKHQSEEVKTKISNSLKEYFKNRRK